MTFDGDHNDLTGRDTELNAQDAPNVWITIVLPLALVAVVYVISTICHC